MKKALFGQDAEKYGSVRSILIMGFKSLPSLLLGLSICEGVYHSYPKSTFKLSQVEYWIGYINVCVKANFLLATFLGQENDLLFYRESLNHRKMAQT